MRKPQVRHIFDLVAKFKVIPGGRDKRLIQAENLVRRLVKQGATFRIETRVMASLSTLELHLTDLKTLLLRYRVDEIEPENALSPPVYSGIALALEPVGDDRVVREFALKVVVEKTRQPYRLAVIDFGRPKDRS